MKWKTHSSPFKKGLKHLHVPPAYRPVSLTSVACKVSEHIMQSSIMIFLDENNILTVKQHSFQRHISKELQVNFVRIEINVILLDWTTNSAAMELEVIHSNGSIIPGSENTAYS